MNIRTISNVSAITILSFSLLAASAVAQQKTLDEQLKGAWTMVSNETVFPDGRKIFTFGPNPKGIVVFDGAGHYALELMNTNIPKIAANDRTQGTPEENKSVMQGILAHFGSYTVNETDHTLTFRIEGSSFANWNNTEQKRPFTVISTSRRPDHQSGS